jgi:hypothetical protein
MFCRAEELESCGGLKEHTHVAFVRYPESLGEEMDRPPLPAS